MYDAARRRDKCEAIIANILNKGGSVPDSLSEELLWAEIDFAVAKDDRHDPLYADE